VGLKNAGPTRKPSRPRALRSPPARSVRAIRQRGWAGDRPKPTWPPIQPAWVESGRPLHLVNHGCRLCHQEGISVRPPPWPATWAGQLIALYDGTTPPPTPPTTTSPSMATRCVLHRDVLSARAYGWHVQARADGNADERGRHHTGVEAAKASPTGPSLIKVTPRSATAHPTRPTPPACTRRTRAMSRAHPQRRWTVELRQLRGAPAAYAWREAITAGRPPKPKCGPPPGQPTAPVTQLKRPSSRGAARWSCPRAWEARCRLHPS